MTRAKNSDSDSADVTRRDSPPSERNDSGSALPVQYTPWAAPPATFPELRTERSTSNSLDLPASGSSSSERRTGTSRPAIRPLVGLSVTLAVLCTTIGYWMGIRRAPAVAPFAGWSRPAPEMASPPASRGSEWNSSDTSTSQDTTSAAWLNRLEDAIVKVESLSVGSSDGLGTGFLIGDGLVATNYHVISSATEARVRFRSGAAYEVAGYAALEPAADLAILQVKNVPPHQPTLPLQFSEDPPQLSTVVAIGHPHGISFSPTDGKVSRVLGEEELPPRVRRFLQQLLPDSQGTRWIQHTAAISEGNSGGPLVDHAGRVVGINTWVDRQTNFGYALHARHLHELQQQLFDRPVPLETYARLDARLQSFIHRLNADQLRSLVAQAQAMNWSPASTEDYALLQQLALAITFAHLPMSEGEELEADVVRWKELVRASLEAVATLEMEPWNSAARLTIINDLASAQVDKPGAGLFVFVTVDRLVEGTAGRRGAILQIAGAHQMLFLPLDDQLQTPLAGKSYLLLGMNYQGRTVEFGDNPLALTVAPVIISRQLIALP